MEYREHENLIFRGTDGDMPMAEFASGGKWVSTARGSPGLGLNASFYGRPMDEAEAREFAGDDWPMVEDGAAAAAPAGKSVLNPGAA